MHDSVHSRRLSGAPPRARLLALATLVSAVVMAGCGGGSKDPSVAAVSSTTTSTSSAPSHSATSPSSATTDGAASASSTASKNPEDAALAYAKCMRANGEPSFPDPSPGGGFEFQAGHGVDPSSPLFQAARAKCQKLVPMPGLAPGTHTHPSQQALTQMLKVAACMRHHGVSDFPEPRTSIPSNIPAALHGGPGVISNIDGVVLVFPGTIDEQSPQFTKAAAECAFPLHDH
ncbi:MAG TPA: hypothetical protein VKS25_14235 [Solirubrobacteraceae bacterium]|nr:hypothetical protein [Solirubrobacteraceae bacterium]